MKKTALLIFAASLLFSCNNSGDNKEKANTGDSSNKKETVKDNPKPTPPPDSATQMKNWQGYMTPGDMHKMMASWNGTWDGDVTMWMPGAPEQKSKSVAVNKMVMGGRYQVSNHTGNMMGTPFEGMSTLAYDNAKKVFISTWIDNMGTGVMSMEGPWDAATKSVTLMGKAIDPATLQEKDYRETFTVIDDNTQVMTMFGPGPDGKEAKTMEIKFSRKK